MFDMSFSEMIALAIIGWIGFQIYQGYKKGNGSGSICPSCGTQGGTRTETKGSLGVEIILWLCFIIPGVIYSIWRLSSKYEVCPVCGHAGMIPTDSPNGRRLQNQFNQET